MGQLGFGRSSGGLKQMSNVVVPALASVVVGGVLSFAAVVGITMSAEQNVRPETVSTDIATTVQNDVQYGTR